MRKKSKNIKVKRMIPIAVIAIGLITGCGASEMNKTSGYDMGEEEILLDDLDTDNLTDADKQAKYVDYLEAIFEADIAEAYPAVRSAEVTLSETEGVMQATISLDLQEQLEEDSVSNIAEFVAKAMDNTTTDNIIIQDAEGNILF